MKLPRFAPNARSPRLLCLALGAWLAMTTGLGCLGKTFTRDDPQPATNGSTQLVLDHVAHDRKARGLPEASIVPELRPAALKGVVAVARGDESLATAAHAVGLRAVQEMGRHAWTFATDCDDLARLRLPPLVLESRELLMNAAAVGGPGGRTFVLIVVTEPGASAIRAEQLGGGGGGTNPSIESYVHPVVAPGRCGDRWPASKRSES
ncbi:MAG TPA: hypothetical protein VGP07_20220 [Polyangia bacterium]|jgi:hypothetical protein